MNIELKAPRRIDTQDQSAREDMEVDLLYARTYRELITIKMGDPQTTEHATRLTGVAHNLERGADRVGNICERVVFSITGQGEELDSPFPTVGKSESRMPLVDRRPWRSVDDLLRVFGLYKLPKVASSPVFAGLCHSGISRRRVSG